MGGFNSVLGGNDSGSNYNFLHNQQLNPTGMNASDSYELPGGPMPALSGFPSAPGGSRTYQQQTDDPTRAGLSSYSTGNLSGGGNVNGAPSSPAPSYNQWTVPTGALAGTPFVNTSIGNNTIGPFQQPAGGWDGRNVIQQYMQDPGWVNSWVNSASLALNPKTGLPQMSAAPWLPQVQQGQAGLPGLLAGTGGALAGVGAPPQASLPRDYAQNYQAASTGVVPGSSLNNGTPNPGAFRDGQYNGVPWSSILATLAGFGNMGAQGTGYGVQRTPLGYTQYQPNQTNSQASGLDSNTMALLSALFGGRQQSNAPTNGLSAILGLLGGL